MQPSDIRLDTVQRTFRNYLELLAEGYLVFGMSGVLSDHIEHSPMWASNFVESLLVRIPPATIWLRASKNDTYTIVHGQRQLRALQLFTQEKYALCSLEYLPEHEGATWSALPHYLQRRIEDTIPIAYCIGAGVPDEVVADILYRIRGLS
jgi:hypothetical protein